MPDRVNGAELKDGRRHHNSQYRRRCFADRRRPQKAKGQPEFDCPSKSNKGILVDAHPEMGVSL